LLDQRGRGRHVDHFGAAGVTHGTGAADHQDAALIDVQRWVVDARVVVLRAFEHDGAGLEAVLLARFGQVGLAEGLANHRHLHDRAVEEVAAEHDEPGIVLERRVERQDHLAVAGNRIADHLADGLAADCGTGLVQAARLAQFMHHRRHAASAVEAFAQVFAGGHAVDQQRYVFADALPVVQRQLDAHVPGDGDQVRRAVARGAQCRSHGNGVFEGFAGHDRRRAHILQHQFADAPAGGVGHLPALAVGRGDAGAARQRHAQGLGQGVHRQRRAHGVAVAHRRRGGGGHFHEAFIVDFACGHQVAGVPQHRARANQLAFVMPVEHRPARQHDGRQVSGGCGHQAGGGGLVTASGQHHAVQRVAVEDLHQPQVGQVAVQGGSGAAALFGDRVDGEFHGDAAGIADPGLDPLGQFDVVAVARGEVAAGLGDADDRPPRLQFVAGQAVVHVTLHVQRGHVGVARVIEPLLAAQRAFGGIGHVMLSCCFSAAAGRGRPGCASSRQGRRSTAQPGRWWSPGCAAGRAGGWRCAPGHPVCG